MGSSVSRAIDGTIFVIFFYIGNLFSFFFFLRKNGTFANFIASVFSMFLLLYLIILFYGFFYGYFF